MRPGRRKCLTPGRRFDGGVATSLRRADTGSVRRALSRICCSCAGWRRLAPAGKRCSQRQGGVPWDRWFEFLPSPYCCLFPRGLLRGIRFRFLASRTSVRPLIPARWIRTNARTRAARSECRGWMPAPVRDQGPQSGMRQAVGIRPWTVRPTTLLRGDANLLESGCGRAAQGIPPDSAALPRRQARSLHWRPNVLSAAALVRGCSDSGGCPRRRRGCYPALIIV